MKRALDFFLAAAGIAALLPLLALIALAVRLEGGGPVVFKQKRVGRNFRPFWIYKFRTMVRDAERRGPKLTIGEDPRITRVGRVLRRTKLDELPQLFNVLRGDMSLVGPRPEVPRYARHFEADYREILRVRPGITDTASILYRDESEQLATHPDPEAAYLRLILPDKIRMARGYVSRASLLYDLRLVCETVLVLAYPVGAVERALDWLGQRHHGLSLVGQSLLAAASYLGALYVVTGGAPPAPARDLVLATLPVMMLIRTVWLSAFHLDRDAWRAVGPREAGELAASTALGTATFLALLAAGLFVGYPWPVLVADWLLCTAALIGVRALRRVHWELANRTRTRRILVVGDGDAAERVVRGLLRQPRGQCEVVGLVGEPLTTAGLRLRAVPVVGSGGLEALMRERRPDEVVLAGPGGRLTEELVRRCRALGASVRRAGDRDELHADAAVCFEEASADELLRASFEPPRLRAAERYRGRRVLVTGAAGAIGSEIARQIAFCEPAALVLLDRQAPGLGRVREALAETHPRLEITAVTADVTDAAGMRRALAEARPEILFHAAAHKPAGGSGEAAESYRTNYLGTRIAAAAAEEAGVRTFVLLTADKAADPASPFGASQRLAELALQERPAVGTCFLAVRFGNVLEGSDSVVTRFREQLERGEPLTISHPEATRWFMTVPEAVGLVLEAPDQARGGEVLVLDMGRPVRILDLAHAMVRRLGLRPEEDVRIVFTGLRPGERLFPKLFHDGERAWKTAHPRILRAARLHGNGGAHEQERQRLVRCFFGDCGDGMPAPELAEAQRVGA